MIERLDWDSDFFDINIGKYEASSVSQKDITFLQKTKRWDGYDLVYVFVDKPAEPDCEDLITSNGGILADNKVVYEKNVPAQASLHQNVSE